MVLKLFAGAFLVLFILYTFKILWHQFKIWRNNRKLLEADLETTNIEIKSKIKKKEEANKALLAKLKNKMKKG